MTDQRGLLPLCAQNGRMILSPITIFGATAVMLWLAAQTGAYFRRKRPVLPGERDDLAVILTAALTLLGLVIGFTFSMGLERYDLRKNYEEEEANAIGTEYVRAGLLPEADGTKVREMLRRYLDQRILYYEARETSQVEQINASTAQLQNQLWSAVQGVARAQPTPIVALAVAGMNDVLNRQGYTQAAFQNRIPMAAWALLVVIAMFSNLLFGLYSQRTKPQPTRFLALPLIAATSLMLIADMDTPRKGAIRVAPYNLLILSRSLNTP